MRHVWLALNRRLLDPCALRRAVAAFEALWCIAIHLDQHCVVNVGAECALDRFKIGLVAVRRELNAGGDTFRHIINEPARTFAVAAAAEVGNEQLRISVDRRPGPHVAGAIRRRLRRRDVLLFRVAERPSLIDQDPLGLHAAHLGVMEAGAEAARVHKQLAHGVDARIRQAGDGAHRSALAQHGEDLGAGLGVELVHAPHDMNFHA